jgi:predicted RNA-binding protein (virulence factor B family)
MSQKYQFRALIESGDGGGAFVIVPFDVEKTFGKKRVKIKAIIDSEPYRGTLVRMGTPHHMLLVLKEIREKIGKSVGDEVAVELEEDLEERLVEVPADLQEALEAQPAAHAYFNRLSYSHQREYVQWITQAKREQTREDRINRMIEMLLQNKSEN